MWQVAIMVEEKIWIPNVGFGFDVITVGVIICESKFVQTVFISFYTISISNPNFLE